MMINQLQSIHMLSSATYTAKDLSLCFLLLIFAFLMACFVKKIFYKHFLKYEYFIFPKLNVKNMTNIAMIIAMNSALIFTVTWLSKGTLGSLFQVYPGARMLLETTLIKIGGIIFGPVIGLFIGAITDLLTTILTSSIINYGYWFMAAMTGFISGFIRLFMQYKGDPKQVKAIVSWLFVVLFACAMSVVFFNYNIINDFAVVNLLSSKVSVSKRFVMGIVLFVGTSAAAMLLGSLVSNFLIEDNKHKKTKWVAFFYKNSAAIQIFAMIFSSYIALDLMALPLFDVTISNLPYEQFLIMRLFLMIPSLLCGFVIIWNVYKLNCKIQIQNNHALVIEETKIIGSSNNPQDPSLNNKFIH